MKRVRKTIAAVLAAIIIYGIFSSSFIFVFAAVTPINITVDSYDSGTLKFHWNQLPGVQSAVISYHAPDSSDNAVVTPGTVKTLTSGELQGLKADYIYDIDVKLYDQANGAGSQLGEGFLYYLPKITFTSTVIDVPSDQLGSAGGRQSGSYPRLKLRWTMPKVYDGTLPAGHFAYVDNELSIMKTAIDTVYHDGRDLHSLNFRVNISSNLNLLNSGSTQTSVLLDANGTTFKASVKVNNILTNTADVIEEKSGGVRTGYFNFELWGHSDSSLANDFLRQGDAAAMTGKELLDPDILPGSVYYMNIKPVFEDTSGQAVNGVTVGNPSDNNGSILTGLVQYAYTPVKFQLTRDSANNIYVKIYKINQGSLDLPRLFYEVQASDDPSVQGDWPVKKTLDDSYFSGDFAVTVLSGININNQIYYRIVVKSDSPNDRLESLKMPYTLQVDTSRPPLPTGITVTDNGLRTVTNVTLHDGSHKDIKSTDITISWDKPLDWDASKDYYFYFLLSTSQSDVTKNVPLFADGSYLNDYQPKYRLVAYVSSLSAGDVNSTFVINGNRLSFTINAGTLFKGVEWDSIAKTVNIQDISNPDNYPNFLMPNTVYYLQMFTTIGNPNPITDSDMSDKSIVESFTTLNSSGIGVPLPKSFALDKNNVVTTGKPPVNTNNIELTFGKVTNLDWSSYTANHAAGDKVYYDLYMSTRTDTDSFKMDTTPPVYIATTENLNGDVAFTGVDDPTASTIRVKITQFTGNNATRFGAKLQPNTTYYFILKTRLHIVNQPNPPNPVLQSDATAILPVTTVNLTVNPPDDKNRKPLAPVDFAIATDTNGNPLLTGNSVTFTWQRQENDVEYEIIRTGARVNPTDQLASYQDDPEYRSLLAAYVDPSAQVQKIYIDPTPPTGKTNPMVFTYDNTSKTCTLTVNRRMFPNKLYYFSLKAVRVDQNRATAAPENASAWVSIPVTTTLIEAPTSLETVKDGELGFFWVDNSHATMTADDYSIYARGPGDADYVLITRSQSTIVKSSDGTYYGRITGLKTNASYDVRVMRGGNTAGSTPQAVFDKAGMATRDSYHEIEVKWQGPVVDEYPYSSYEIAIRPENASEYTVLDASDLVSFTDSKGRSLPFYREETSRTVTLTDTEYFYARIKSMEVTLPGGLVTHQPLLSNVKYYIKVRALDIDSADAAVVSYSKYIGPVNTRTDFSQGDYDNTDREEKQEAVFMDRMKEFEQGFYWRIAINNNTANRIILKGDKVVSALSASKSGVFSIDMTDISVDIDNDEIYVPLSVIKAMNTSNKSLVIQTSGASFTLRPRSLDASVNQQIKDILTKPSVKDIYIKLTITAAASPVTKLPAGAKLISAVDDLGLQAIGSSMQDSQLKQLVHDKLYDQNSGLVGKQLSILQNTYIGDGPDAAQTMEDYTKKLIELIESDLSSYISDTIESMKLVNTVQSILDFSTPASAAISYTDSPGTKIPYVLYDGSSAWQKAGSSSTQSGAVSFNIIKTGQFAILLIRGTTSDVPADNWASDYVSKLASKYDLSDVFPGSDTSFMPGNKVSCKDIVLLYEKVTGRTAADTGMDIRQKTVTLGLDGVLDLNGIMKNVKRQEAAAVLVRLFAVKKGLNPGSLKPGGNVYLADEAKVDDDFYNQVLVIVDMKVMSADSSGNFNPLSEMTRAETAAAFVKLLGLTGDM